MTWNAGAGIAMAKGLGSETAQARANDRLDSNRLSLYTLATRNGVLMGRTEDGGQRTD